ncbi:MAG: tetratricopeptide repeat protein [Gammaproteobacteria bacterium]
MSLLIDVLTKADQANSDEPDGDSAPPRADGGADDTQQAQHDEAGSELSLAPDDDSSSTAEPAAAPDAEAPGDDEGAPAQPEAAPATAPADERARGRPQPRPATRARALKLAALIGAPALLAAALLSGQWAQQDSLTPIDYGDDTAFVPVASRPVNDVAPPARDPAAFGPPIPPQRKRLASNERVLVAELSAASAAIADDADAADEPDTGVKAAADEPTDEPQDDRIVIEKNDRENPAHANMRRAYDAFREGDYPGAIDAYQAALEVDPLNQDALLGLAALALRTGDALQAAHYYEATLDLDPNNSVAIAGLVALQEGGSPIDRESFLKNLLYERPTAAHLHFSLGIQYASQARWSDAQQAFFDAFSHDPSNADYAFNLAVSLDRLGQGRSAADYYRRSLDLASGNHVIDTTAAQRRLEALTSSAGEDSQ